MRRVAEWRLVDAGEGPRRLVRRVPRCLENAVTAAAAQVLAGSSAVRLDGGLRSRLYRLLTFLRAAILLNPNRFGGCHDRA